MKTLLFILSLGLMASVVSADPPEPPEFVNCPDRHGVYSHCDSISYTFEAVNPNHPNKCNMDCNHQTNHCRQIRYHLISGPGTLNEKTGEWFWNPTKEDTSLTNYLLVISASIGNSGIETDTSEYCRYSFWVRDSNPRLYIDEKPHYSVFIVNFGSTYQYDLSLADFDSCETDNVVLDSVVPNIPGAFTIDNQKLYVDIPTDESVVRYVLYLTTENYQENISFPFIFDTRENPVPVIVECPDSFETAECGLIWRDVHAVDKDSLPNIGNQLIRYNLIEGPGFLSFHSGHWRYRLQPEDIGEVFDIKIAASYGDFWSEDTCSFTITVGENTPGISIDRYECNDTVDLDFSESLYFYLYSKNAFCETNNIEIVDVSEPVYGEMWISNELGDRSYFYFMPAYEDGGKNIEVTFGAKDGRDSIFCSVVLKTAWNTQNAPYKVFIDTVKNAIQGEHVQVAVKIDSSAIGISGYDLLIGYDNAALSFQFAEPGQFLIDCGWEYFTYRYGSNGDCTAGCPTGLLRITSIAETNNGPYHPSCYSPNSNPATLATIDFLIPSHNNEFECTHQPIKFYWMDCGDNSLADVNFDLLVSDGVYDYVDDNYENIADSLTGFPTFTGIQPECLISIVGKPTPIKFVDFYNGFVDIACPDTTEPKGDVNLNFVHCEVADLVLFSNAIIYGDGVYTIDKEKQILNTDMNHDSSFQTIEDFVLLKRCVTGEQNGDSAFYPVSHDMTIYSGGGGMAYDNPEDDSLGALFLVVEGQVTPTVLQDNAVMLSLYNPNDNKTKILIYTMESGEALVHPQPLLTNFIGEIVSGTAATYAGRKIELVFDIMTDVDDDNPDLPTTYALGQNYPNPFNNATVIHFDLPKRDQVRFEIYNILGETVYSIDKNYSAGSHTIYWDGKNSSGKAVASGLYYYRIEASDFVDSKKMILLK